jgi:glycosyl transferase family 25
MTFMAQQMDALGLSYERLEAVTPGIQIGTSSPGYWDTWERPLKETEKACFLSHVAAWKRVEALGEPALILEDDVLLSHTTPLLLEACGKLNGIDHITFEVRKRKKVVSKQGSQLTDAHRMLRLFQDRSGAAAYVLWPSGAAKLLRRAKTQAALADAMICKAYELNSFQIEPASAVQLDRTTDYGVTAGQTTQSIIGAGSPAHQSKNLGFKLRRISAQLRMGLRALRYFANAERREISLSPGDFDASRRGGQA